MTASKNGVLGLVAPVVIDGAKHGDKFNAYLG